MSRQWPLGLKPALYACAGILFVVAAPAAQQTPPETPFRYERPVQAPCPGAGFNG